MTMLIEKLRGRRLELENSLALVGEGDLARAMSLRIELSKVCGRLRRLEVARQGTGRAPRVAVHDATITEHQRKVR